MYNLMQHVMHRFIAPLDESIEHAHECFLKLKPFLAEIPLRYGISDAGNNLVPLDSGLYEYFNDKYGDPSYWDKNTFPVVSVQTRRELTKSEQDFYECDSLVENARFAVVFDPILARKYTLRFITVFELLKKNNADKINSLLNPIRSKDLSVTIANATAIALGEGSS